jgi:hypothetical protein
MEAADAAHYLKFRAKWGQSTFFFRQISKIYSDSVITRNAGRRRREVPIGCLSVRSRLRKLAPVWNLDRWARRITGSDRSKHQYRKRLLPSTPDIAALIPLFGIGNRRLIYMTNEVLLVFLNTPLVPVFRQLRRELVPSSGVFRFESIA